MPPDTPPTMLSNTLRRFSALAPNVQLEILEMTTSEQLPLLREGSLDIGIVRHPSETIGLESSVRWAAKLGVWLSADHPLAVHAEIRLRDLNGSQLVTFPRSWAPDVYDQIMLVSRTEGFSPSSIRHARHPGVISGLLEAGLGVHFNVESARVSSPGVVFRQLLGSSLAWQSSVVWNSRNRTEVTEAFLRAVFDSLEPQEEQIIELSAL
ncbi:MAG: LysR family substrate-binding domain-containing protein [Luteolibacter sp.]